jgi:hypothetical protein
MRAIGRWLRRSGDPANLLAGVRLITDSRPSARLAMMVGCCGFLVGTLINGLVAVLMQQRDYDDSTFYATGFGMAVLGLLLVILTAMGALIVGVADQLVDQRRQLACLTALGVDVPFLRRVIRRQLTAVAAPALAAGLLFGMLLGLGRLVGVGNDPVDPGVLISTTIGLTAAGWLLGQFGGSAAGFLLRNQLRDALDPENLRAA